VERGNVPQRARNNDVGGNREILALVKADDFPRSLPSPPPDAVYPRCSAPSITAIIESVDPDGRASDDLKSPPSPHASDHRGYGGNLRLPPPP